MTTKTALTKLAEQVFQMLPKEDKSSYTKVVDALKKRFCSVEIEELKGLEESPRGGVNRAAWDGPAKVGSQGIPSHTRQGV